MSNAIVRISKPSPFMRRWPFVILLDLHSSCGSPCFHSLDSRPLSLQIFFPCPLIQEQQSAPSIRDNQGPSSRFSILESHTRFSCLPGKGRVYIAVYSYIDPPVTFPRPLEKRKSSPNTSFSPLVIAWEAFCIKQPNSFPRRSPVS